MTDYTRWELWFHYVLLTVALFIGHHFSTPFETQATTPFGWLMLFGYYYVVLTISDLLIHFVLQQLTGWED